MSGSIGLAFGAGLLATVNPCGFAMLPSFLGVYLGEGEGEADRTLLTRLSQGFLVGLVLSGAFSAVYVGAGLVVSAGARSFVGAVPWLASAIALGLIAAGLAMLAGRHFGLRVASRLTPRMASGRGFGRVGLFGATFAIASLSCTLPVFLLVVSQAIASSSPIGLLAVFGAYAAGSASVLLALSLSAALAKGAIADGLRRFLPLVNRVSGALLIASGAYLILYWLPTLSGNDGAQASAVVTATRELSAGLQGFFSLHASAFAVGLAGLVAIGVALLVASRLRHDC